MTNDKNVSKFAISRRGLLAASAAGATSLAFGLPRPAIAQAAPLKIGLMLPSSGTFAKLGQFIDNGFSLYVEQKGGMLGGRPVEFIRLDDESKPETDTDNMNRLVGRDEVVDGGDQLLDLVLDERGVEVDRLLLLPGVVTGRGDRVS